MESINQLNKKVICNHVLWSLHKEMMITFNEK